MRFSKRGMRFPPVGAKHFIVIVDILCCKDEYVVAFAVGIFKQREDCNSGGHHIIVVGGKNYGYHRWLCFLKRSSGRRENSRWRSAFENRISNTDRLISKANPAELAKSMGKGICDNSKVCAR